MNRRGFFALPLTALVGSEAIFAQPEKFIREVPKPGNVARAPVGAIEVSIEGKIYHAYLWEPQK